MKIKYHLMCALIVSIVMFFPQPASAKCVALTTVSNDGTSGTLVALVPDSGSADIQAAGFQDTVCGNFDKADYRARVCKPELIGNHGVQRQLELQAGVSFAQLCSSALAEAGLPQQAGASAQGSQFLPSNQRPPVPRGGPGMVGPLGQPGQLNVAAGGK